MSSTLPKRFSPPASAVCSIMNRGKKIKTGHGPPGVAEAHSSQQLQTRETHIAPLDPPIKVYESRITVIDPLKIIQCPCKLF